MNDGSMFGGLHQYGTWRTWRRIRISAFIRRNTFIRTEYLRLSRTTTGIFWGKYDCNEEPQFQAFLDSVMSVRNIASHFSSETTATVDDRIITLSTCNGNSEQRFLW